MVTCPSILSLQFISKKPQIRLHIFNSIVCVICFVVVAFFGFKETLTAYQMGLIAGIPLEPPKWILTISIPIGFLLLMIQFLRRIRGLVKKLDGADQEQAACGATQPLIYDEVYPMEWYYFLLILFGSLLIVMGLGLPVAFAFMVIILVGAPMTGG